jgi:hypothetical protein
MIVYNNECTYLQICRNSRYFGDSGVFEQYFNFNHVKWNSDNLLQEYLGVDTLGCY